MTKDEGRKTKDSQTAPRYPLMDSAGGELRAASGRPADEITLQALATGELTDDDLRITADALREQAAIAQQAGFPQLAANLRRAAELTVVPNDELLRMYEILRPGRSTCGQMLALADRLVGEFRANETAAFVREAAEVYRSRGLAKQER
jgi:propanediol dehydratase small subunit